MCLPANYIGIRGTCDGAEPVSGLYINDLPGISLSRAVGTTDEVFLRGVDFLRANERLAFEMVRQDFKAGISRDFRLNSVIDTIERKISYSRGAYLPIEAGFRWVRLRDDLRDQLATLRINNIELYARNAWSGFTFDLVDGAETHTYTVNLTAGINNIPIRRTIESGMAYIKYDASQVELWEPDNYGTAKCADSACLCDCSFDAYIKSEYFTGPDLTDLSTSRNRNGIAVNATLWCDLDTVFCQYVDAFKFAIWVKMGILIAEKYLSSDRSNFAAFAAKQDAVRLLTQWKGGVDSDGFEVKSEYWKHFTSAYNQIKEHMKYSGSLCFECATLQFIHQIP
jgi:hypothetical protein